MDDFHPLLLFWDECGQLSYSEMAMDIDNHCIFPLGFHTSDVCPIEILEVVLVKYSADNERGEEILEKKLPRRTGRICADGWIF